MYLEPQYFAMLIAILAGASAGYLAVQAVRQHEPMIWSAVLPRVYIAVTYAWFALGDVSIDTRMQFVRLGFIVLFLIENLNHVLTLWGKRHAN